LPHVLVPSSIVVMDIGMGEVRVSIPSTQAPRKEDLFPPWSKDTGFPEVATL